MENGSSGFNSCRMAVGQSIISWLTFELDDID